MIITAELHAFGGAGKIREIVIQEADFRPRPDGSDDNYLLALAFKYGQNEIQPSPMRSLSVGDIVILPSGRRYLCEILGWRQV